MNKISEYFAAPLERVNFAASEEAREIINTWVEEQTNDKIHDLIPPGIIDGTTVLVLANAIYFKGLWRLALRAAHFNFDEAIKSGVCFCCDTCQNEELTLNCAIPFWGVAPRYEGWGEGVQGLDCGPQGHCTHSAVRRCYLLELSRTLLMPLDTEHSILANKRRTELFLLCLFGR